MRTSKQKCIKKLDEVPKPRKNTSKTTKTCDTHEAEKTELVNGKKYGKCTKCKREIRAKEIDEKYFQDTGEIVVLEWERV